MQGCAKPRKGLPFDNPAQAKRSAGATGCSITIFSFVLKSGDNSRKAFIFVFISGTLVFFYKSFGNSHLYSNLIAFSHFSSLFSDI
jgi:hypothetical protein